MPARRTSARPKPDQDPLKEYRARRDFTRTSEPAPALGDGQGWQFVVQKHDARRVHYDLRLELDGTLKSWAVTRGPSLVTTDKRLAVRTEDHPMQYLDFEGNIPKGAYGAGAMIVWDRGRWSPVFDPVKGLAKGHLEFTLDGRRLKGRWHLVRLKPRPGEKKEQWLLIKADDEHARTPADPDILEEEATSVLSGRTTQELAAEGELRKDHAARAKVIGERRRALPDPKATPGARKGILPAFIEPSLPQPAERPPNGAKWVHEIKYDGYRIEARVDARTVQLLTRKGLDWTARFSGIAVALERLGLSAALIDGEVVVEDETGLPSFTLLQKELQSGRGERFRYFAFDLLYYEGYDLTGASLRDRKALLHEILADLPADAPLRFSEHLTGDGPTIFEHAARLGLEGIVSKRIDLPHRSGRGSHWVKTKGALQDEFVILGYVPSSTTSRSVGALLAGYYDRKGTLFYAGRVGTGFSSDLAKALRDRLEAIRAVKPALGNALPAGAERGVRWSEPQLVGEIEYRGWTNDGLIRQSAFKGLREDRTADEAVIDPAPAAAKRKTPAVRAPWRERLTHPERLLWPERGITKEGLAVFYADIAEKILPHIRGRALSLVRHPSGVDQKGFFAKHAWSGLGEAVRRIDVGGKQPGLAIEDLNGLIELVQAGVVEIHPWGATVERPNQPDRLIFDLDPGEGVPWTAVIEAAREVRERLEDAGLTSFVKTSGGKGLHVVVPLRPQAGWDEAKAFTRSLAQAMAKARPDRYVATMSRADRTGRIYIDFVRNSRGATAVAPYSTRATPAATVSTPLAWEELSEGVRADHFKIDNLRRRLDVLKDDPWPRFFTLGQTLPAGGDSAGRARPRARRRR